MDTKYKEHGTNMRPVMDNLRYGVDPKLADKLCNFNRNGMELYNYAFSKLTRFEEEFNERVAPKISRTTYKKYPKKEILFYDSVNGREVFKIKQGGWPGVRSHEDFIAESKFYGWLSFRDDEVNWAWVRVIEDGNCGEVVTREGTHLGHNMPEYVDGKSYNRYNINLACVAGRSWYDEAER